MFNLLIQYHTVYNYTKRSHMTALCRIYLLVQYVEKSILSRQKLKSEPRCLLMENGE